MPPHDEVELRCEFQPPGADASASDVSDWLQRRIKTLVGISTRESVLPDNTMERTLTGEARRVIDKRSGA